MRRILALLPALLLAPSPAPARPPAATKPVAPKVFDFEADELGKPPAGLVVVAGKGYSVAVDGTKPHGGAKCVRMQRDGEAVEGSFCRLDYRFDVQEFAGRVRVAAFYRAEAPDAVAPPLAFLRSDAAPGTVADFANKPNLVGGEWQELKLEIDIPAGCSDCLFGVLMQDSGTLWLDDLTIADIGAATKPLPAVKPAAAPGLFEVKSEHTVTPALLGRSVAMQLPLPLSYRDQVPLTFDLTVTPPEALESATIRADFGPNKVLELRLRDLKKHGEVKVKYAALVLVAPSDFAGVPATAKVPEVWPEEAGPWLAATWCVSAGDERVKQLAAEARRDTDDARVVVGRALKLTQAGFAKWGRAKVGADCTAASALGHSTACTARANLVAAVLRAAGVPARVVAGYPAWSGPLLTHYVVEAYLPGYGWYPLESTMGQEPWPNFQQVQVAIIPPESESREKADQRANTAGGVPYLSLVEHTGAALGPFVLGSVAGGVPGCDHVCLPLRKFDAKPEEWAATLNAARAKWQGFVAMPGKAGGGKLSFGAAATARAAQTLAGAAGE